MKKLPTSRVEVALLGAAETRHRSIHAMLHMNMKQLAPYRYLPLDFSTVPSGNSGDGIRPSLIRQRILLPVMRGGLAAIWLGFVLLAGAQTPNPESKLRWFDPQTLCVEGKGWTDTKQFYDRLPQEFVAERLLLISRLIRSPERWEMK